MPVSVTVFKARPPAGRNLTARARRWQCELGLVRASEGGDAPRVEFQVERVESVDSTSERLFERLRAGRARNGDVVVAAAQSAGRGRQGRRWHSPPGEGLYLSVLVVPGEHTPAMDGPVPPPAWTLAGGLAVLDLVRELGVRGARLEWPNDLMVAGAKLAGVLAESRAVPAMAHCVLGIGLDVRQRIFPAELLAERPVTSLSLLGVDRDPDDLVEPLLRLLGPRLEAALAGGASLASPFVEALDLGPGPVRALTPDGAFTGELLEFDLKRGIRLSTARGERRWPLEHLRDLTRM